MNQNKIVPLNIAPFDSFDAFKLPSTPPKQKYIDTEDSSDLPEPSVPTQILEKVKLLPLDLQNTLPKTIVFDTVEDDSPKSKSNRQNYYSYFKVLVNEQNTMRETKEDDTEVIESIEEKYERLMEEPIAEQNMCLYVTKRSQFDLLKLYTDKYPFLETRKSLMFIKNVISLICFKIISSRIFETLSLLMILWNTVMLFMDDPYSQNDVGNMFDVYFQSWYTVEMSLKTMALGFIFNEGSYLRNGWNILDFFIVVTGFLPYVVNTNTVKLSGLRTLRVLRPLKTISSLKNLKLILLSLFSAMPMILNAAFILFFVLLIYAIAALQLFMGTLKRRCFNQYTGLMILQNFDFSYVGYMCGYKDCPQPDIYVCGKLLATPNTSITNFDTCLWCLLMMFQEITLENWSINMYYVARTFSYYIVIFFISLAFIGAMIFLNLLASIISQAYEKQRATMDLYINSSSLKESEEIPVTLEEIRKLKFIERNHHKRMDRSRKAISSYGVNDNFVFVPRPDDMRWQDILDLKLQKIVDDRMSLQPLPNSDMVNSEVEGLLNYIEETYLKQGATMTENEVNSGSNRRRKSKAERTLLKRLSMRKSEMNVINGIKNGQGKIFLPFSAMKNGFHGSGNKGRESISLPRKSTINAFHGIGSENKGRESISLPRKSTMNAFHGFGINMGLPFLPRKSQIKNLNNNEKDIEEIKLKKTESPKTQTENQEVNEKKTDENERVNLNLSQKVIPLIKDDKPIDLEGKSQESPLKHYSTLALKSISKLKIFSKFLQNPTTIDKKEGKIKVIDYMLMVDFSKIYSSESEADVMMNVGIRKKQMEAFVLEQKLKNSKCALKFKTNLIDTSEMHNKNIKKQTQIINSLPMVGRGDRTNDPKIIRRFMNGKTIESPLKIPIIGCHNFIIMSRWRKHIVKFEPKNSNQSRMQSMFQSKRKNNNKAKPMKRSVEEIIKYEYNDLKFIVKENLLKEGNNEEIFTNEEDYMNIKKNDYDHKTKMDFIHNISVNLHWSGEDIYDFKSRVQTLKEVDKFQNKVRKILRALTTENQDFVIWLPKIKGKITLSRKYLILYVQSQFFENFFLFAVVTNTIVLSLYGYLNTSDQVVLLDNINANLTYVFVAEMGLKILAMGIIGYVGNLMNLFDGSIVVVSIIDLVMTSITTNISAFRSVRILRIFRILRPLHYMKRIISVFTTKFYSFIYIWLLLILLIIIYTLIGVQIYAGQLNNGLTGIRQSFDTMYLSFLSVFQLVTIENWNDIETITLNSGVGASLTVFYLLSLIILGNYVFLNLFLGVLLDGFSENISLDDEDPFDESAYQRKLKKEAEEKEKERVKLIDEKICQQLDSEDWEHIMTISSENNKKEKELFTGIECRESLWLFSKHNLIRILFYEIVFHPAFEYFILFLIFCNSVKLGLDSYIPTDGTVSSNNLSDLSTNFDIFFNSCFTMEAFLKIIVFGLFMDAGSYLRSYWNILDLLIVIGSLVDMLLTSVSLPYLKIFRMMRILRVISHNPNMKMVVLALLSSIVPILNLVIFMFFIYLIFAIMGVTLMGNRMGWCSTMSPYYGINKAACIAQGQTWASYNPNFDNIFNALVAVFILSTQEGWPTIMYFAMDGDTDDNGPSYNASKYIGWYYVAALSILNFFLINMFVGVLCNQFEEAKENNGPDNNLFISAEQKRWISYQSLILNTNSSKVIPEIPTNPIRLFFHKIIKHKTFDSFLMVCIITNIISLGLNYEGASANYNKALENINYAFTAVFVTEFLLKIIALGPKVYFSSNWNKFDFTIVICSLAEIIITQTISGSVSFLRIGPQIIRIFRVLRVTRVLKLIKRLQNLSKLIETLISALPQIANVGTLYVLVYYIYAILGTFFYGNITNGQIIDEYNNFQNVWYSFVTCFRMVTGENWWVIMYDCYNTDPSCIVGQTCGNAYAPLYFISLQIIQGFIIQSLFILIILKVLDEEENPAESFKKLLKEFRRSWNHYTIYTQHKKIHSKDLLDFFKGLGKELGFEKMSSKRLGVEIMKMNIESDENGYTYFHEVLFATIKRVFGTFNLEHLKPETLDYVTRIEVGYRNKLQKLLKKNKKEKKHFSLKSNKIMSLKQDQSPLFENNKKKHIVNPLIRMLFLGMVWNAWTTYTKRKINEEEDNDYYESSNDDDEDDSEEELKENN